MAARVCKRFATASIVHTLMASRLQEGACGQENEAGNNGQALPVYAAGEELPERQSLYRVKVLNRAATDDTFIQLFIYHHVLASTCSTK